MIVNNLTVHNFINQIANASNKDKIGWGGNGMTLTTGATFKERLFWRKPDRGQRQLIAQTLLNSINHQVEQGNMGINAKSIGTAKFNKLVAKIVNGGLSVKTAKRLLNNVVSDTHVNRWHPLKALGMLVHLHTGHTTSGQLRDIEQNNQRG